MRTTTLALFLWTTAAPAAELVSLDATQRAAFGVATTPAVAVDTAWSPPYPAKVQVPNAQLRVVSAPLEGLVEALLVAEGEAVAAGQPLARVRSPGLLEHQAAFLEARTRRLLAGESAARDRKLHAEGVIAERRLLESQSVYRELRTTEERHRQTLTLAGMSEAAVAALARDQRLSPVLEVASPLAGVVLEQLATAGQRLAASDPLYRIGSLEPLWLEVHVPLADLGGIAVGNPVRVAGQDIGGRVITVGRMVHGGDQGVLVRAEVGAGSAALRPGQFVEVGLARGAAAGAVRLPAAALVRLEGREHVFVERPGGFAAVAVEVGSRDGDGAVVRGDLGPDEAVVSAGTAALKAAWAGGGE